MSRKDATAWVVSVCSGSLRKSQVTTLSVLVAATLSAMRLSLAGIGREMAAQHNGAAKYGIKRVYRFLSNAAVEPVEVMPAVMTRLMRRHLKRHAKRPDRRPVLVSLDWTKVRRYHVLMAAMVVDGRALPLCWESYADKVQSKSQNALEEAMLLKIRSALPPGVRIVVMADRGFGRASLIEVCQRFQLDYLIRINAKVHVKTRRGSGRLDLFPVKRGTCRGFKEATYRSDGVVATNLLIRWKTGLPRDKDRPWYLATSLPLGNKTTNRRISDLYKLRFDIEELFRDAKNEHLGWSLAKTRITRADRLDRLILVAALAYVLMVAAGLWCRKHLDPRLWCANRRIRELSAFAIARVMLDRIRQPWRPLVEALLANLATTEGNWG
jgi:hypothetical protein